MEWVYLRYILILLISFVALAGCTDTILIEHETIGSDLSVDGNLIVKGTAQMQQPAGSYSGAFGGKQISNFSFGTYFGPIVLDRWLSWEGKVACSTTTGERLGVDGNITGLFSRWTNQNGGAGDYMDVNVFKNGSLFFSHRISNVALSENVVYFPQKNYSFALNDIICVYIDGYDAAPTGFKWTNMIVGVETENAHA